MMPPVWPLTGHARPRPPIPTREQILTARCCFQGETATTSLGTYPWWDVPLDTLDASDRQAIYAMKRAEGDQVCIIAVSHAYLEPWIPPTIGAGKDWTSDLSGLYAFVDEIVRAGFYVQLHLAGDGQSVPKVNGQWVYNDPVGFTYGHQWLMDTFGAIASALCDLTPYIRFVPGFDAVFYGWDPDQVQAFGQLFRALIPDGYLALEHDMGHIPCGEGGTDYLPGGRMVDYDLILGEFPPDITGDVWWQILGRMVRPYHRPNDQPVGDDPNPPFYLQPQSPRGPFYYCVFEWQTYDWVRGFVTRDQIDQDRQQIRAMGPTLVA